MDFLGALGDPSADDGTPDDPTDPTADGAHASPPGEHPLLTYAFGTGDGAATEWSSRADRDLSGDGVADAVSIDFDGDGHLDDAMWDSDGDGRVDLAALDVGGDDPDRFYSDTGRGLWDHRVHDVHAGAVQAAPPTETPVPSSPPASVSAPEPESVEAVPDDHRDLDGDGRPDDRIVDPDSSGRSTVGLVFAGSDDPHPVRVLIDLDGDRQFDGVVIDADGDGVADTWALRGQSGFDAPAASAQAR
ncbi:hypothetical protein ACQ7HM_05715 [Williamsia sp. MIQD14]|uniref:hypothetical protein n=1 Tax=Williamsia sp. MIQD14 TaxID=3425703 RepID=UPI003DA06D86